MLYPEKAMAPHSSTLAWKIPYRSLVGCSPWGREESDTTERLLFHFSLSCMEKEMATHSSVLAWRIPGTGEPGGLPSMGLHRVGHDWSDLAAAAAYTLSPYFGIYLLHNCKLIWEITLALARKWAMILGEQGMYPLNVKYQFKLQCQVKLLELILQMLMLRYG